MILVHWLVSFEWRPRPKKPRLDKPLLSLTDADSKKLDEKVVKRVNKTREVYNLPKITPFDLNLDRPHR